MRFLADENVGRLVMLSLEQWGGDVASVAALMPGSGDSTVLAFAAEDRRVLVTFDRDYGELIFRGAAAAPPAVIYLRMDPADQSAVVRRVLTLLDEGDLEGHLVVVEAEQFRRRSFPLRVVRQEHG